MIVVELWKGRTRPLPDKCREGVTFYKAVIRDGSDCAFHWISMGVNDSADRERVAQYLTTVRTERMGFRSGDVEHDRRIAELLITWKELIWEKYEGRS